MYSNQCTSATNIYLNNITFYFSYHEVIKNGANVVYIFLSHDIDWGKAGPSISHVNARKERFDETLLECSHSKNLYYNIPEYMEIEETYGVRSTFFFRTNVKKSIHPPLPYLVEEYEDDIHSLVSGGWEIGLHLDPSSHENVEAIRHEKETLERIAGVSVVGNRVHYTMYSDLLFRNLNKLAFTYDSSPKFNKEMILPEDFGYFMKENLSVFPITIMDAHVFMYLVKKENQIIPLFEKVIDECSKLSVEKHIITVNWHGCVLNMKLGRQYKNILAYLTSLENVNILRGLDLHRLIEKGIL